MSSIFFPNASSSSSNSYVPSKIIVSTHNIPHLNAQLQPSSNIFGLEYNQPWNTYTQSILPIPIAIGILGCLSILILTISLLARPLFGRCKCSPKERFTADGEIDKSICVSPTFFSMKNLQFIFYATAFLAIIADQALYFGNVYISNGVSSSVSSINTLSNTFNNINAQNLALIVSMNSLTSDAALCGQSSHIVFNPMMTKLYNNSVSSLTNYIAPIPTSLSHVSDTLTTYGTTNKNNSIWILYGCVIAVILSFQIGMCVSNKRALQVSIVMSELLILAFIVICAIEMFLVMIFSDYCMDPNSNAAKLVNPTSTAFASSQYFLTCQGVNPLQSPLVNLSTSIEYFTTQVANITSSKSCTNTAALHNMQFQINSMQASYVYIVNNTQCPAIQSSFDSFSETNLCGDTFLGFYIIWLSQYLTAGCLFMMTVVASVIYQLFGRYWDDTETDILVKTLQSSAFEKPKYNPEEHYDDLSTNERKSRKERADIQLSTDTYDSSMNYGSDEWNDGFGGSPISGNRYNSRPY